MSFDLKKFLTENWVRYEAESVLTEGMEREVQTYLDDMGIKGHHFNNGHLIFKSKNDAQEAHHWLGNGDSPIVYGLAMNRLKLKLTGNRIIFKH